MKKKKKSLVYIMFLNKVINLNKSILGTMVSCHDLLLLNTGHWTANFKHFKSLGTLYGKSHVQTFKMSFFTTKL